MSNNELIKMLSDYKNICAMESELKKEKDKLSTQIKKHMENENKSELFISEYHIIYNEIVKKVIDSDLLKKAGLYNSYLKEQKTRPLFVK